MIKNFELEDDSPLSRQSDMVSPRVKSLRVLVIGAGGIGSNAIHVLASMGVLNFQVIEFDEVGMANIHPGFFDAGDARNGVPKTQSVMKAVQKVIGDDLIECRSIEGLLERIEVTDLNRYDIVIVGTDSLESRRNAFDKFYTPKTVWIDGRMGGTGCDVFCYHEGLDEETKAHYVESMKGAGDPLPCGMKSTAAMTKGFIPGMIGDIVRDHVNGDQLAYHYRYDMADKGFLVRYSAH